MNRPDVLVIGGGPAGAAAAITGAQLGLRVTLVEREAFPRARPGETLHPGVEPLLAELGVAAAVNAAGFVRHAGIRIAFDGVDRFEEYGRDASGPWLGYQAPRDRLDALLLDRARSLGVQILQPCRARHVEHARGRITAVATDRGTIEPRFVVDASGSRAWLAQGRLARLDLHLPGLVAQYGYARGAPTRDLAAPVFEAWGSGWLWLARIGPTEHAWTRLLAPGEGLDRAWLPPAFAALEPVGPTRAADVSWRLLVPAAAVNGFAVGDAAARLDPGASRGVLRALVSGRHAAQLIGAATAGALPSGAAAGRYRRWVEGWYRHDLAGLTQLYAAFEWLRVPRRTTREDCRQAVS